ncbi:MAG: hypothetical protein AB1598_12045 [Thermodesulfobacteriota bacterium]
MKSRNKWNGNSLGNNMPKNKQKQSEYEPLRTGWIKLDLQEAWREFISRYDYDLFVTLTFRDEIKPWIAKKRFEKWLESLNLELFGEEYKQEGLGIRYALSIEYQKRGILHFHALLGAKGLKEINREYMAKLWKTNGQRKDKAGPLLDRIVNGHAVIKPYDPAGGAIRYMTKHIRKGVEPDIFIPRIEREG